MTQSHVEPKRESTFKTPRWVNVAAIIVVALVLLFVILHLTGNGFGPSSHMMPMPPSGQQP